jgi:hypothetical protein
MSRVLPLFLGEQAFGAKSSGSKKVRPKIAPEFREKL